MSGAKTGTSRRTEGLIFGFVGATLWGLSSVCSDYLMSNYPLQPLSLTMIRMCVATICFLLFVMWRFRPAFLQMLRDPWSLRHAIVYGVAGLFMCQLTYIVSISCTNAGTATVMQSLNIVFIPIVTWLFGKSKLTRGEKVGAALAFASVVCLATKGDLGTLAMPLAGLLWGLANGVTETFYVMYPGKLFDRWGSVPVTAGGMAFGAVAAVVVWLAAGVIWPGLTAGTAETFARLDLLGWAALVGVCVIGTFVAFAMFLHGVALIGPVETALLGAMEPISSAGLCAVLLGTAFVSWDWIGLALMVCTIFIVTLRRD